MSAPNKLIILLIVPAFLYLFSLPGMPLMEPDEGRYSLIPATMNERGDYLVPRLKGAIYIEKPPLAYWITAFFFKVFGEGEFSSRLFAGLSAWGVIILAYLMGCHWVSEKVGLWAAAVLSISLFHFVIGHINILDMPVTFLISLALWGGFRFYESKRKGWLYLFYSAMALAFLTKGLIGIFLPGAVILLWLISLKKGHTILQFLSPLGIGIFLAIALPWPLMIHHVHPDFARFFFLQEHFLRYTTEMHHRNEPFYYYFPILLLGTTPWVAFAIKPLRMMDVGSLKGRFFPEGVTLFLFLWFVFIILFFSFSSSKLVPYIAPVFLPLSLFGGRLFQLYEEETRVKGDLAGKVCVIAQSLLFLFVILGAPFVEKWRLENFSWLLVIPPIVVLFFLTFLPDHLEEKKGCSRFFSMYVLSASFLFTLLFPVSSFLVPHKSAYPLVQAVKRLVPLGEELYQYNMSLYGLDFYGKMRTPVVNDIGEVAYGSEFLPEGERSHYFLGEGDFINRLNKEGILYCATKGLKNVEKLAKEVSGVEILWDNGYYYLVRLKGKG